MYCIIDLKLKHFYVNTFHTAEIEDEEILFTGAHNRDAYAYNFEARESSDGGTECTNKVINGFGNLAYYHINSCASVMC